VKKRPVDIYILNKYILVLNLKIGVISFNLSGSIYKGNLYLGQSDAYIIFLLQLPQIKYTEFDCLELE